MTENVQINSQVQFGAGGLGLISGPCVIESRDHSLRLAETIRDAAAAAGVPLVFKASFDKANRTSIDSYRGPGMEEGLDILAAVKDALGVPVLTDIHTPDQAAPVAEVADILQIPAFLCRQTDLLVAAARTGRAVNVKKGQFLAPADMKHVVGKLEGAGAEGIMLTERGNAFGYNNLVVDFKGLCRLQDFGYPVVFDVTHSLQLPGAGEGVTAGERRFAEPLALAATATGVDVLFIEAHNDPAAALSDGSTQLPVERLEQLLHNAVRVHEAAPARSD